MHLNKLLCIILISWVSAAHAQIITPEKPIENAVLESQAQEIFSQLRCVVCSGQDLKSSNAPLAQDMRQTVRNQLIKGHTPDEVRQFFVERYGDEILQKPPLNKQTYILWFGPLLVVLLGFWLFLCYFKQYKPQR